MIAPYGEKDVPYVRCPNNLWIRVPAAKVKGAMELQVHASALLVSLKTVTVIRSEWLSRVVSRTIITKKKTLK